MTEENPSEATPALATSMESAPAEAAGPAPDFTALEVARLRLEASEQELAALTQSHLELEGQLADAQLDHLAAVRRALLAEQAGQVVPELVQGRTPEELEASLTTARQAFDRIAGELRQQAAAMVPIGASVSVPPSPDALTPIQKITHALSRSGK